jgi:hypothetical protein
MDKMGYFDIAKELEKNILIHMDNTFSKEHTKALLS